MEIRHLCVRLLRLANLLLLILPVLGDANLAAPMDVTFGKNVSISGSDPAMLSQNESAIAANPRNPDNLVVVFQGKLAPSDPRSCFFAFTIDRGKTWQVGGRAPLEGPGDFCADPAVAADDAGNFYFSYIDLRGSGQSFSELDILVAKSVDGGM